MKTLIALFLISPLLCFSQEPEQKGQQPQSFKISIFTAFEKQGFEEVGSINSIDFVTFDKYGPSLNYGADFQLSRQIFKDFQLNYGLGFNFTSHSLDYYLLTSSSSDYQGFANEMNNGYYLSAPISIYFHKKDSKRFYFSPGLEIKPQILIYKKSEITHDNYVYDYLYFPGSEFNTFVPKLSLDFSFGYEINNNLHLLTGLFFENNPKYYKEDISNIFFRPVSFGIKIAINRINF
jgi:hypothetical protein